MRTLAKDYRENVEFMDRTLRVAESFDVLCKTLRLPDGELSLYFIDGFVKDTVMQKLMTHFLSVKKMPPTAGDFMRSSLPYVETDVTADVDVMIQMVMSGATLVLGSSFGDEAIIIDSRTYPARETAEL